MAASASLSPSGFYALVRSGRAPPPDIIRGSKFSRWRASTCRDWLRGLSDRSATDCNS